MPANSIQKEFTELEDRYCRVTKNSINIFEKELSKVLMKPSDMPLKNCFKNMWWHGQMLTIYNWEKRQVIKQYIIYISIMYDELIS